MTLLGSGYETDVFGFSLSPEGVEGATPDLILRIYGGHTLGARFVSSTRNARYGKLPDKKSSEGSLTLSYSFLGSNRFSAVRF